MVEIKNGQKLQGEPVFGQGEGIGGQEAKGQEPKLPPTAIDTETLKPRPGVPIKEEDLRRFHDAWLDVGYSPDALEKIEANLRFIGEEEFKRALREMADRIASFVGDQSFALYVDKFDGSGGYVVERLLPLLEERGLSPTFQFAHEGRDGVSRKRNRAKWRSALTDVDRVVFIDEASYSGSRASHCLHTVREVGVPTERIGAFFVAATEGAVELNREKKQSCGTMWYDLRILQLKEIFDEETLLSLSHLPILGKRSYWGGSWSEAVLTFFYFKVADNFLGNLKASVTGSENPHIVNDESEGVYPPYWKARL